MPVRSSLEIVSFSRPSDVAIKRKRNPQTDTFRRLIYLICYFSEASFRTSISHYKNFTEERLFGERETSKYMIRNTKAKKTKTKQNKTEQTGERKHKKANKKKQAYEMISKQTMLLYR